MALVATRVVAGAGPALVFQVPLPAKGMPRSPFQTQRSRAMWRLRGCRVVLALAEHPASVARRYLIQKTRLAVRVRRAENLGNPRCAATRTEAVFT